jgi:hypothetical protein
MCNVTTRTTNMADLSLNPCLPLLRVAALVVYWLACWPLVPKIAGSNPADFFRHKNTQHAFLQKGSKTVRPVSQICGTKKNPVGLRGSWISQAKLFGHFTLEVPSFANRGLQRSSRFGLSVEVPLHSSSVGALWSWKEATKMMRCTKALYKA